MQLLLRFVAATTRRRRRYVTSFSFKKEVTKKVNQRLPPLETAFVPRYKVYQEIDISLAGAVLQGSYHARQAENARFVKAILLWWSGWERDPPLAGAIVWHSGVHSPYRDRRSCSGYAPVSSLKVFGGVGTFFQKVPTSFPSFLLAYSSNSSSSSAAPPRLMTSEAEEPDGTSVPGSGR